MEAVPLTVREIAKWFNQIPVEGKPNVYIIQSSGSVTSTDSEMTKEDWDKFEQDISDAFEQIP